MALYIVDDEDGHGGERGLPAKVAALRRREQQYQAHPSYYVPSVRYNNNSPVQKGKYENQLAALVSSGFGAERARYQPTSFVNVDRRLPDLVVIILWRRPLTSIPIPPRPTMADELVRLLTEHVALASRLICMSAPQYLSVCIASKLPKPLGNMLETSTSFELTFQVMSVYFLTFLAFVRGLLARGTGRAMILAGGASAQIQSPSLGPETFGPNIFMCEDFLDTVRRST